MTPRATPTSSAKTQAKPTPKPTLKRKAKPAKPTPPPPPVPAYIDAAKLNEKANELSVAVSALTGKAEALESIRASFSDQNIFATLTSGSKQLHTVVEDLPRLESLLRGKAEAWNRALHARGETASGPAMKKTSDPTAQVAVKSEVAKALLTLLEIVKKDPKNNDAQKDVIRKLKEVTDAELAAMTPTELAELAVVIFDLGNDVNISKDDYKLLGRIFDAARGKLTSPDSAYAFIATIGQARFQRMLDDAVHDDQAGKIPISLKQLVALAAQSGAATQSTSVIAKIFGTKSSWVLLDESLRFPPELVALAAKQLLNPGFYVELPKLVLDAFAKDPKAAELFVFGTKDEKLTPEQQWERSVILLKRKDGEDNKLGAQAFENAFRSRQLTNKDDTWKLFQIAVKDGAGDTFLKNPNYDTNSTANAYYVHGVTTESGMVVLAALFGMQMVDRRQEVETLFAGGTGSVDQQQLFQFIYTLSGSKAGRAQLALNIAFYLKSFGSEIANAAGRGVTDSGGYNANNAGAVVGTILGLIDERLRDNEQAKIDMRLLVIGVVAGVMSGGIAAVGVIAASVTASAVVGGSIALASSVASGAASQRNPINQNLDANLTALFAWSTYDSWTPQMKADVFKQDGVRNFVDGDGKLHYPEVGKPFPNGPLGVPNKPGLVTAEDVAAFRLGLSTSIAAVDNTDNRKYEILIHNQTFHNVARGRYADPRGVK